MHDGRFASLEEVIEFYSTGVQANPNLDPIARTIRNGKPLRLNWIQAQIDAVVAFLNTLTDYEFLTDTKFSDPVRGAAGRLRRRWHRGPGRLHSLEAEFRQCEFAVG